MKKEIVFIDDDTLTPEELAESFAHVLEEKGLDWKKEWRGSGGGAPFNGITKANYRGCNSFWLSLVSMMKGYDDPRWVTMVQIMDKESLPSITKRLQISRKKDSTSKKLCGGWAGRKV